MEAKMQTAYLAFLYTLEPQLTEPQLTLESDKAQDFVSKFQAGNARDKMAVLYPEYDWEVAPFDQQPHETKFRVVGRSQAA
jgi:hypothetical protein